jgi:hypothetical protein
MAGSSTTLTSGSMTSMSGMSIGSVANGGFILTIYPASSLPACYTTACAPCYVTARPYEMTFPEFFGIQDETYTFDVIPHVTQMPNGTASTMYETLGMNASSMTDMELRHEYTWTTNGMTL